MKRQSQAEPFRKGLDKEDLHYLRNTMLEAKKIFFGFSLCIKGEVVGEYTIAEAGGDMSKLVTVVEKRIPLHIVRSWEITPTPPYTLKTSTGIEDTLGKFAVNHLARVHQVIELGKRGPGRFGGGMINLHFVKYKRETLAVYWWTIKKRLYIWARPPVLTQFWKKGNYVHAS